MTMIPVRDVGMYGVSTDKPAHELPPNVWTRARNVRAKDGSIQPMGGETLRFINGVIVEAPWNLFYCPTISGAPYWIYCGSTLVGVADSSSHVDITPLAFTFSANDLQRWTGAWLNGVFILNTSANECHAWDVIDPTTPALLKPMSAIVSTEFNTNWRFGSMRAFKEILIGMDFFDGSTRYPTTLKWSGPAAAGTVPIEWDAANLNNISGEYPLSATPGKLIDGMQLGDNFIVCKEDSTYKATFSQGASALSFKPLDLTSGVMNIHCMAEYSKGKMVILNQNADLMITDGISVVSVLTSKLRIAMQKAVNVERLHQCFLVNDPLRKEVRVCFPTVGEDVEMAKECLIWNYVDNTFTFADVGRLTHMAFGKVDDGGELPFVDDIDIFIDAYDEFIDGGGLGGSFDLVAASQPRGAMYSVVDGATIDGVAVTSFLERTALALVGQSPDKTYKVDHTKSKLISGIWPVIETEGVSPIFQVSIGAQERRDGPTTWDGPYAYDADDNQMIDVLVEGIYITVKIETDEAVAWKLHGYSLDVSVVGDKL